MPLVSRLGAASSRGFGQLATQASVKYIEDYFSTYLYTGTGSAQAINNGIALSDTAAWSSITSTLSAGTSNTFFVNGNGIYYAGANGANTSSVIGVSTASGSTLFNRNLSGTGGNDFYNGITGDSAGNIICVGRIATGLNASIVKYDSSGALQWQRQISGGGNTARGVCVACDSSNNIYVGGVYTTSYSRGLVAKYNSSGVLQWQRFIYDTASTSGTDISSIAVGSAGDVYICGKSYDAGSYPYAFVAKINTSGTFQWSRSLKVNYDSFDSISVDSSDNVYVCGSFNQISTPYGIVAKYNSSGTLQWQVRPSTNVTTYACAADTSGNVYVNIANLNLTKISTSGSLSWTQTVKPSSGFLYGVRVYGTNVYASCLTAQGTAILATDNSTLSGTAGNITVYPASNTITTASGTGAAATVAVTTSSLTESALSQTDSAGSLTSAIYTQAAVTGAGGLVWMKGRSGATDHALYDTARGATFDLVSNSTAAQTTQATGLTAFSASGFSIGSLAKINTSTATYASWSFRKQPKFFDVVTYSGTGSVRTISHNLGSIPGMMIIKRTDSTSDWMVYHRSLAATDAILLNSTAASITATGVWNSTRPTATVFTLGTSTTVNDPSGTYVAYIFAHNAGGFGADGLQNVISCGTFNYDGSTGTSVTLGYEPQWVLYKSSTAFGGGTNWQMHDVMRGMPVPTQTTANLTANGSGSESTSFARGYPTATGFTLPSGLGASDTYIYMAIRRGPMRTPTSGTSVFSPTTSTGTGATRTVTTGLPVDLVFSLDRPLNGNNFSADRLTAAVYAYNYGANPGEVDTNTGQGVSLTNNTGFGLGTGPMFNTNAISYVYWAFQRSPSVFDAVAYTGTGSNSTQTHNLGVPPELIIVHSRSGLDGQLVYAAPLGNTKYLVTRSTNGEAVLTTAWNSTSPTSTQFSIGTSSTVNASGTTYVAYLFASCPGVSKIGSYSGTGATQTIDCGFTGGARFVLIKRTDTTGAWYIWDTARGMVAGTDPYLLLNSSAAEVNTNSVYTTTGGFQIVSTAADINASGGTYLYWAVS